MVFEVAVALDVVALAYDLRLGLFGIGQLCTQCAQLDHGLFDFGGGLCQVAAHGGDFDFLRHDACTHTGHHLDRGCGAGLECGGVDAGGAQFLVGLGQAFFGFFEFAFKEGAAQLRFAQCQSPHQLAQFFDIPVGHIGGKLGVFVVKLQADDAVFACNNFRVGLQLFAGVDFELFIVAVLQLKALNQAVLKADAF